MGITLVVRLQHPSDLGCVWTKIFPWQWSGAEVSTKPRYLWLFQVLYYLSLLVEMLLAAAQAILGSYPSVRISKRRYSRGPIDINSGSFPFSLTTISTSSFFILSSFTLTQVAFNCTSNYLLFNTLHYSFSHYQYEVLNQHSSCRFCNHQYCSTWSYYRSSGSKWYNSLLQCLVL